MRRTAKAAAAVAGISLALAACGGDSGTTNEPAAQTNAPTDENAPPRGGRKSEAQSFGKSVNQPSKAQQNVLISAMLEEKEDEENALPSNEVKKRLEDGAGSQWDPDIVDAFLGLVRREHLPEPSAEHAHYGDLKAA